jgi:hypothetical protein
MLSQFNNYIDKEFIPDVFIRNKLFFYNKKGC